LFSLDAEAHRYDIILAATHRHRFGHTRCCYCSRHSGSAFVRKFVLCAGSNFLIHRCWMWLRVPVTGIPALYWTRVGTPGSSFYHLLYRVWARDFSLLQGIPAVTIIRRSFSGSPAFSGHMLACRIPYTACFHFRRASSRRRQARISKTHLTMRWSQPRTVRMPRFYCL
jgi:hypothetical protein